jgi:ribosome-associated heat shock protein Hsp15
MVTESVRADAWVWAVRLYKSRTQATTACRAGHVRVNGDRAKAATHVKVGDRVVVRIGGIDRVVEVKQLLLKRVGAEPAAAAYIDHTPAPPPPEFVAPPSIRDRGTGRPTKKERRQLDRLRGRA